MKYTLLPLLIITLISCSKKDSVTIAYNSNDFVDKVKVEDTACINQTKRAAQDIAHGKYVFDKNYFSRELSVEKVKFLTNKDFENLGIVLDSIAQPPIDIVGLADKLFQINCYQKKMYGAMSSKFGKAIDSIALVRGKEYVKKHPDEIFEQNIRDFNDSGLANQPSTKVRNQITYNEVEFENKFIYPEAYKPKNEKNYSHTSTDFILMKNGEITDIKVNSSFFNPDNEKFEAYFEKAMRYYIMQAKWVSPVYFGLKVNCKMHFTFFHK